MDKRILKSRIHRRLFPLYMAAFLQNCVLWYAVEKFFMKSIGFDDALIGVAAAVMSTALLLAEAPSGILADRWSRKGVLVIASIALALSGLAGGLSPDYKLYMVSAILWGVYYGMNSGTFESIVYDTLLEEKVSNSKFEHYYGRIVIFESIALAIGGLFGALLGALINLRAPFLVSVPLALLAIVSLAYFREPRLHKQAGNVLLMQHITNTLRAVLKRGLIIRIAFGLILLAVLFRLTAEFYQLWFIDLATPVIWLGPLFVLMTISLALSGLVASKIKANASRVSLVLGLFILAAMATIFSSSALLLAFAFSAIWSIIVVLRIILSRQLHDRLGSNLRAGSSSVVSSIGSLLFVPVGIGFGWASKEFGIFSAAWVVVIFVATIILISAKLLIKDSGGKQLATPSVTVESK